MTQNDPFADADRTILVPSPGGRRPPDAPPPAAPSAPLQLPPRTGLNPLEGAAATLLTLMMNLRNTPTHADPMGLRNRLIQALNDFTAQARKLSVPEKTVLRARYVLCTALDEVVLNTPWGHASDWSEKSLLVTFHNETWGGEKFFQLLDLLLPDPAQNIDLLELMYICLAFGFEGRYRLLDNGQARLEAERERLYHVIRNFRGDYERELSPHWRGVTDQRNPLMRHVPLWVAAALAGLLLLGIYFLLLILLNRFSDPVFDELSRLRGDAVALVQRPEWTPPPPPPPPPDTSVTEQFQVFLEQEIAQGLVQVIDEAGRTTIRILGDGLFDSGRAEVKSDFLPLLQRIAKELNTVEGPVLVTGHTDSIPINTLRFPSNWKLSKERAATVTELLQADSNAPARFTSEGRADTEPVATNATAEGRARNRRVDITLLARLREQ